MTLPALETADTATAATTTTRLGEQQSPAKSRPRTLPVVGGSAAVKRGGGVVRGVDLVSASYVPLAKRQRWRLSSPTQTAGGRSDDGVASAGAGGEDLDLSNTPIGPEDFPFVCFALGTQRYVSVRLGACQVPDACGRRLLEAVARNPSLRVVDLTLCRISKKWVHEIERVLRERRVPSEQQQLLPTADAVLSRANTSTSFATSATSSSDSYGDEGEASAATTTPLPTRSNITRSIGHIRRRRTPPPPPPPASPPAAAAAVEREEHNERCRALFLEDSGRRRLAAFSAALRQSRRVRRGAARARAALAARSQRLASAEAAARPLAEAAERRGFLRLVEKGEALRRAATAAAEAEAWRALSRRSTVAYRDGWELHRRRAAQRRSERAALALQEREGRFRLLEEMLDNRADLGDMLAELQREAAARAAEGAARAEEERRRQGKRQADDERQREWRADMRCVEQRRLEGDRQFRRGKLEEQEARQRKGWVHGTGGREAGLRQVLEQQFLVGRALAVHRERAGNAARMYTEALEELPVITLESATAGSPPGVHFVHASTPTTVDPTMRIACDMPPGWAARVAAAARRMQEAARAVEKARVSFQRQTAELLRVAGERAAAAKLRLDWVAELQQELRTGEEAEAQPEVHDTEEMERCKRMVWGGALTCRLCDEEDDGSGDGPVAPSSSALLMTSAYVSLPAGAGSSVTLLLPTDGTATYDDVTAVLASLQLHSREGGEVQGGVAREGGGDGDATPSAAAAAFEERGPCPPRIRHVEVELSVMAAADAGETLPPRFYAQVTAVLRVPVLFQERHIQLGGDASFEFQEGEACKPLLDVPLRAEPPANVRKDLSTGGHVIDDETSFDGTVLTVDINTNYTRDDQIFLLQGGEEAVTIEGPVGVCVAGVKVGCVYGGTFKRYHPTGGAAKIPPVRGLRDLGPRYPGQVQRIAFNASAGPDAVCAVLRSLRFLNVSPDPLEGARCVSVQLADPVQKHCTAVSLLVTVEASDDATVVAFPDRRVVLHAPAHPDLPEAGAAYVGPTSVPVAETGTVTDVDTRLFSGGTMSFTLASGYRRGDRLFIMAANSTPGSSLLRTYPPVSEAPPRVRVFPPAQSARVAQRRGSEAGTQLQYYHSMLDDGEDPPVEPQPNGRALGRLRSMRIQRRQSQFASQQQQQQAAGSPVLGGSGVLQAAASESSLPRVRRPSRQGGHEGQITCFGLPNVDGYGRVQVWYGSDLLAIATFVAPRDGDYQKSPRSSSAAHTVHDLLPARGDCVEILVQFVGLPDGVASIQGTQELVRCIHFGSVLISPREGVRDVNAYVHLGNTVKGVTGFDAAGVKFVKDCPNRKTLTTLSVAVLPALLRLPPRHAEFAYVEGSGLKKIAGVEVVAGGGGCAGAVDDGGGGVGGSESYSGWAVNVELIAGCTDDDILSLRGGDADGLDFVACDPAVPPPAEHLAAFERYRTRREAALRHEGGARLLRRSTVSSPRKGVLLPGGGASADACGDDACGDSDSLSDLSSVYSDEDAAPPARSSGTGTGSGSGTALDVFKFGDVKLEGKVGGATPPSLTPPTSALPTAVAAAAITVRDVLKMDAVRVRSRSLLLAEGAAETLDVSTRAFDEGVLLTGVPPQHDALKLLCKVVKEEEASAAATAAEVTPAVSVAAVHRAIADQLNAAHETSLASEGAKARAEYVEIRRGEGVVGYVKVGRGVLCVVFGDGRGGGAEGLQVRRRDVLAVLRSVAYMSESDNPLVTRKVIRFSFGDVQSHSECSAVVIGQVVPVDNPTSVLVAESRRSIRHRHLAVSNGCAAPVVLFPLGDACVDDPDTSDFSKGALAVEATHPAAKYDHFFLLSPDQQRAQAAVYNATVAPARGLPKLVPPIFYQRCVDGDEDGEGVSMEVRMNSETGPVLGMLSEMKVTQANCSVWHNFSTPLSSL